MSPKLVVYIIYTPLTLQSGERFDDENESLHR